MRIRTLAGLSIIALSMSASVAAARQTDPHPTFTVGTATANRGETVTGVIAVPAGSDAALDIPVVVVHGAKPGPVLSIVSGAHGTEYASIIALEKLIGVLDAKAVRGTVIIVPLVNVPSFEQKVAHINPVDRKSMNRYYPGNANGTQTERASLLITQQVVEPADHLIDLHGGDLDESLRPYSYWTVTGDAKQDSISRALVLAFGLDHIIVSSDRPKDPAASRYLENTASTRGKPSFTAEAGYAGTVMSADVDALVNGSLNVMAHLRMLAHAPKPNPTPVWITQLHSVASEATGIFYPRVKRDQRIAKGTTLGVITDYVGKTISEPVSPADGIVLFVRAVPSMTKGETVANIGVIGKVP